MHQGKLNCWRPTYRSSKSDASVFTMNGFVSEVPYEVDSLKKLISFLYLIAEVGVALRGNSFPDCLLFP